MLYRLRLAQQDCRFQIGFDSIFSWLWHFYLAGHDEEISSDVSLDMKDQKSSVHVWSEMHWKI
ncbi:hypothetical protein MC64_003345 [Aeromonas caviae]|nr:hypothetical protein MC64_003345 [Aeromonas caviae]